MQQSSTTVNVAVVIAATEAVCNECSRIKLSVIESNTCHFKITNASNYALK